MKSYLTPLILLIVLCSCPCAPAEVQPLKDCEVLARVNGQVVLACELSWEVELMLRQRLASLPPEQADNVPPEVLEQLRAQLMQQLLMGRLDLILFYADFRGAMPQADLETIHGSLNKSFVAQEVPSLMERLEVEKLTDLEDKLYELGTTVAERREDYYKKMIARSWLTETVEYEREVTHDDMLNYYSEHASDYATPERARWEELMVRFDRFPTKQAAYAEMARLGNLVYQQLNARRMADAQEQNQAAAKYEPMFAETAKTSSHGFTASDGGQHDWTTRGSLAADKIDATLFTLTPGEMSTILEGPHGFHIVRVLERQQAGKTPFREVQNKIRDKIRDDRFNTAIEARVTELKKGARIWTVYTGDIDTSRVGEKPMTMRK